jgi:hypothetical protein
MCSSTGDVRKRNGLADMQVKLGSYRVDLPHSRVLRLGIGIALVTGGALGFLPVLGFWMLPLGFIVLGIDLPSVRRLNRKIKGWWTQDRFPK